VVVAAVMVMADERDAAATGLFGHTFCTLGKWKREEGRERERERESDTRGRCRVYTAGEWEFDPPLFQPSTHSSPPATRLTTTAAAAE